MVEIKNNEIANFISSKDNDILPAVETAGFRLR